jgi:hypothetical protein
MDMREGPMLLMHGTCDRCVDLLARSEGLFSITTPRTEDAMDESNDIDVVLGELFAAGDRPEPCADSEAEVLHRVLVLLVSDFPGLSPLSMDNWPRLREGVLWAYSKRGCGAALFCAHVEAMQWVFDHPADRTDEALDFALEIYARINGE